MRALAFLLAIFTLTTKMPLGVWKVGYRPKKKPEDTGNQKYRKEKNVTQNIWKIQTTSIMV